MTDTHSYQPDPIAELSALAQAMSEVVEQMRPSFTALEQTLVEETAPTAPTHGLAALTWTAPGTGYHHGKEHGHEAGA